MTNNVLYEAHPSMFRNRPIWFVVCILLIPLGVGILFLLVWWVQAISTKIMITDGAVLYEKGLLSKSRVDLKISRIRTVTVKQGVVQRMLGAGNLAVYTAGDKPEVVINGVKHPHKVRELLTD